MKSGFICLYQVAEFIIFRQIKKSKSSYKLQFYKFFRQIKCKWSCRIQFDEIFRQMRCKSCFSNLCQLNFRAKLVYYCLVIEAPSCGWLSNQNKLRDSRRKSCNDKWNSNQPWCLYKTTCCQVSKVLPWTLLICKRDTSVCLNILMMTTRQS